MSVTVTIRSVVQPDKVAAVKEFLQKALPDTRVREGSEGVTVHQNQDDPTSWLILTQWASRAHYEGYLAWRVEMGTLAEMLVGEPTITYYDFVSA